MRGAVRTAASALALLGALAALGGCASAPACAPGQQAMLSEWLYFGTQQPGGTVGAADWQAFVDTEVTPRFPQGFSVWPAQGQWKSDAGPIVREASYVLNVVHEGGDVPRRALGDIAAAYKLRFKQEAVLRVASPACVAF